ncbi:MAG TPA: DUF1285 domain-containing protein [Myxococcaceae bacterium]|nr:DUF1285 domain-containing protein [Myxococcaceae bacterium]
MAEIITRARWHTREDSGLALDRQLRWTHDGLPFEHPKVIELFNTSLQLEDDGRYVVRIGKDWAYVQVEDAAFEVRTVDVTDDGRLSIRLSDRTATLLDLDSLERDVDGVLTCRVKEGRAKARFSRDAQFQLGSLLEMDGDQMVLRAGESTLPLPRALQEALESEGAAGA